jgi:hypothetical protein
MKIGVLVIGVLVVLSIALVHGSGLSEFFDLFLLRDLVLTTTVESFRAAVVEYAPVAVSKPVDVNQAWVIMSQNLDQYEVTMTPTSFG